MPVCTPCGRSFVDKNALLMHTNSKHPEYECTYCDRMFKTSKGRDQHEESKHPEHECSHCDRTFKTSKARDQHEESKHPEYECSHCDRTFKTSGGRNQHERTHKFHCGVCGRNFLSEGALRQHDEALHSVYECRYCDKEFTSAEGRAQHQHAKHAASRRPNTVYSSSHQLRDTASSSLGQSTAAIPAPVDQPRVNEVLDALSTPESTPTPSGDYSEVASDNHSDVPSNYEPSDDYSDEPSDDYGDEPSNDYSDEPSDDYSDEPSDDHCDVASDYSDVASDDRDEVSSDDRSEVSIMQSPKVQVIAPKSVANFACKACGEHFATILALGAHELREHTHIELCACRICERVGQPCSCGICKRASMMTVLAEDEKPLVSSESDENVDSVDSVDSARAIEPKAAEDSSIESRDPIVTVDFQEPIDPLLDEHRDIAEDTSASQHEQTLPDMEHVVDGKPSSGLTYPRPISPPGNENDRLGSSTCQITEMGLKEEGVTLCLCPYAVRPECYSIPCDMDVPEQHAVEAASIDSRPVTPSPIVDERTHFSDQVLLMDTTNSKTEDYSMAPAEARDDQQTILDADTKPLQNNLSPQFEPCVPELDDNASSVDSVPMQRHSPQCIRSPQVCAAELELPKLDDPSTRDLTPSPTPSEQGSLRPISIIQESHILLESCSPLSPSTSEGSADYFSDVNPSSTPSSPLSEHSIVFVSAESIPEYLRENRAYLIATSAPSRPSSVTSSYIRLPSVATSLDSTPPQGPDFAEMSLADSAPTNNPSRLYCRVCLRDPCDDLTATMCGHVFCNRCIIDVVMARSACPVCNAPTLLYCLFRLDI